MDLNLRVERIAVLACLSHARIGPGEQLIGGAQRHHAQHTWAAAAREPGIPAAEPDSRSTGLEDRPLRRRRCVDAIADLLAVLQVEDQPVVSLGPRQDGEPRVSGETLGPPVEGGTPGRPQMGSRGYSACRVVVPGGIFQLLKKAEIWYRSAYRIGVKR